MSPKGKRKLKPIFKPRPRKQAFAPPPAPGQTAVAPSPVVADGGVLGRRRDQLARQYAELQSDLGGLVYEMAIRDHFRLDVVTRQAAKLQAVDAELASVEGQLQGGATASASSCRSCGAALQPGAAFCAQCGTALAAPLATAAAPTPAATPISASAPASQPAEAGQTPASSPAGGIAR